MSNSAAPLGSVTTVARAEALDQRPRDAGVDRRDEPDPQRRQPRREQRHRDLGPRPLAEHVGHHVEHLAVGEDVRAADLHLAPRGRRRPPAPARGTRARRRCRSAACRCSARRGRSSPAGGRPGSAASGRTRCPAPTTIAGAEVRERRALLGEDPRGLVAAAQVLGRRARRRARRGRRRGRRPRARPSAANARAAAALALVRTRRRRRGPSSGRGSRRRRRRARRPRASAGRDVALVQLGAERARGARRASGRAPARARSRRRRASRSASRPPTNPVPP